MHDGTVMVGGREEQRGRPRLPLRLASPEVLPRDVQAWTPGFLLRGSRLVVDQDRGVLDVVGFVCPGL